MRRVPGSCAARSSSASSLISSAGATGPTAGGVFERHSAPVELLRDAVVEDGEVFGPEIGDGRALLVSDDGFEADGAGVRVAGVGASSRRL